MGLPPPNPQGVVSALRVLLGIGGNNGQSDIGEIFKLLNDYLLPIYNALENVRDNTSAMVASLGTIDSRLATINTSVTSTATDVSNILLSLGAKGERDDMLRLLTDSRASLAILDTGIIDVQALLNDLKFYNLDVQALELDRIVQRLGLAQNGLSVAEQLQAVRECICNDAGVPVDPAPIFPTDFACAPANATEHFRIRPSDWYQMPSGNFYGVPVAATQAFTANWSILSTVYDVNEAANGKTLVYDESTNGIKQGFFAYSSTTEVIGLLTIKRAELDTGVNPQSVLYAASETLDNLTNNSGGCEAGSLWNVNTIYNAIVFTANIGGSIQVRPSGVLVFYTIPS